MKRMLENLLFGVSGAAFLLSGIYVWAFWNQAWGILIVNTSSNPLNAVRVEFTEQIQWKGYIPAFRLKWVHGAAAFGGGVGVFYEFGGTQVAQVCGYLSGLPFFDRLVYTIDSNGRISGCEDASLYQTESEDMLPKLFPQALELPPFTWEAPALR